MGVLKISNDDFKKEVLDETKIVLVDFYADWCAPCKMLAPIVEEVAKENQNVKFVKINVDESPNLAMEYDVMSIPTLIVIKKGKEINRMVGLVDKSELSKIVK